MLGLELSLQKIREQLKILENSLRGILSFARKNPANPISARKKRVTHNLKLTSWLCRTSRRP
jgi:hypothetical protein